MQILAFRAVGHNLASRLPRDQIDAAAGAIGVRDVQGAGVIALHARVAGARAHDLARLIAVVSARGTDTLVPRKDIATFTIGTVPADEESLRARLKPVLPVLDKSGHTATEALELAKHVARHALSSGPIDIGALSGALTNGLPELSPMCRGRCGVRHIDQGIFDLVGESGVWRRERTDAVTLYAPMKEPRDREKARAELLRRYLRCYGPSTAKDFADWCGIGAKDAAESFKGSAVVEVAKGRFLLEADVARFEAPPDVKGVRILPPRDPYLLGRDRATLIPDREMQKRVWRATPTDGVVLVDGTPVASWRPKKAGTHLTLNLNPFVRLTKAVTAEIEAEAAEIAGFRGCESSSVAVA